MQNWEQTKAVQLAVLADRYPGKVALGLDVRGREVAVRGWVEGSGRQLAEVAAQFDPAGFAAFIVTQINVDGAGTGPDVALYAELLETVETDVIASGGVGSAQHLRTGSRCGSCRCPPSGGGGPRGGSGGSSCRRTGASRP